MGAIGAAAGGATKALAGIFGSIASGKAIRRAKAMIEDQRRENRDWYDRRYNEDATQRADAQRILTLTQEQIRNRNRQSAATRAVAGGTEESVAADKAANAQAMADAAATIAMNGERRKDAIEQQYRATDSALAGQLEQLELDRGANIAAAAGQFGDAAMEAGKALPW